ncbi:hypothetical protein [Streptomyces phaeolivaceus]
MRHGRDRRGTPHTVRQPNPGRARCHAGLHRTGLHRTGLHRVGLHRTGLRRAGQRHIGPPPSIRIPQQHGHAPLQRVQSLRRQQAPRCLVHQAVAAVEGDDRPPPFPRGPQIRVEQDPLGRLRPRQQLRLDGTGRRLGEGGPRMRRALGAQP